MSVHLAQDDGVALLTLDDAATGNALGPSLVSALAEGLEAAAADPSARVVVVCGRPDVFSSGAPRELLLALAAGEVEPGEIRLGGALLACPLPTIAAMEGHAVGGGLALGLCADLPLFARESRYGANFLDLGFTPGMGTTRLLEHVLTPAVAHELLFTGALRRGSELPGVSAWPRAEVRRRALDLARRIADKPRTALELLKAALAAPRRALFAEATQREAEMHRELFRRPETRARILAAYVDPGGD